MRNFYNRFFKTELRGQVKPSDIADVFLSFIFLKFKRFRNDIKDLFDYATSITQLVSDESRKLINDVLGEIKISCLTELIDVYYEEKKNGDHFSDAANSSLYRLATKL